MSRINDLIKEMCPNGVEFKSLKEVFDIFSGMTGVTNKWAEEGNCQFIDYMNAYKNNKIDITNLPYATVKNINQIILVQGDLLLTSASEVPDECAIASVIEDKIQDGVFMDDHLFGLRLKDEYKNIINTTFISYYLNSKSFRCNLFKAVRGVTRFYISNKDYMKLNIPIPPIEIQKEIVRILDKFGELEAELEAELEVRKSQYEFWRGKLFEIKDSKEVRLDELFNLKNGFTPSKSNSEFWENGTIPWFRMEDIRENGRILDDSIQHVTVEATKGNIMPANSIIISTSATIGEHALINCKSLSNQRFTYLMLKDEYKNFVDMKYIFYHCFLLDKYCLGNLNQGNFASIDMNAFKKYIFKIPSLEKQKKIVSILDKFDALTSNITIGLPAEIELRRKQYEYYRNKLLSFEELR